jgi:plasmid maintenance system antidote protein VapI
VTKSKAKQPPTVSEALRAAIEESGGSLYRVAKDAKISYATLHRFVNGQRSLSMDALEKLCASLGLELRPKKGH